MKELFSIAAKLGCILLLVVATASLCHAQGIEFQTTPHHLYFDFDNASGNPINRAEHTVTNPTFVPPNSATLGGSATISNVAPLRVGSGYLSLPGLSPTDRLNLNHPFGLNPDPSTPLATNTENDDEWTIEFWIYLDPGSSPTYPQHIFGDPSAQNFDCKTTNGSDLVLSCNLLNQVTITGLMPLTWHHIAFVFDVTAYTVPPQFPAAASILGYLDGILQSTVVQSNPNFSLIGTSPSGLGIGGSGTLPSMRGRIDEFRLWYQRRTRCQLIDQRNWKLPLWQQFSPYGLPPDHPNAPDPFVGMGTLDPTIYGAWEGPWDWEGTIQPVPNAAFDELAHAILLPTGPHRGEVLFWINDLMTPTTRTFVFDSMNPTTLVSPVTQPTIDIFCSGHSIREDGTIVVPGGINLTQGGLQPREIHVFDPVSFSWSYVGDMCTGRFYPTVISLTKPYAARSLILGGSVTLGAFGGDLGSLAWETYPGSHTCGTVTAVTNDETPPGSGPPLFELYPRMAQLSSGQVIVVDTPTLHTSNSMVGTSWLMTLPLSPGTGAIDATPTTIASDRAYGSMVLMHRLAANGGPDLLLDFGGSSTDPANPPCRRSTDSVERFDINSATWVAATPPMKAKRHCANTVILPTGDLFVVGGGWNDAVFGTDGGEEANDWIGPVFLPELYTPDIGSQWMAPPNTGIPPTPSVFPVPLLNYTPRVYHSLALLLQDGRVLVAGGEELFGDRNYTGTRTMKSRHTGEIFNPPYHYQKPRPRITNSPDKVVLATGENPPKFSVRVDTLDETLGGEFIDRVVILRPGAVTHHFDNDQRYVELAFESATPPLLPGPLTLKVNPPSESLAPPGYYLLFVVATNSVGQRIPSEGVWIQFI